jgi:hypothetical protein
MSFLKWLFADPVQPPQPILIPKEQRIKALREQATANRIEADRRIEEAEKKFLAENPDKYKLVVTTEDHVYESKEISASVYHIKRTPQCYYPGMDEEAILTQEVARGPYDYVMPTLRTAKENAEEKARGIVLL